MSTTETPAAEVDQAPRPHPWDELPPEHFQLLRLAPLPADASTGLRPLRFARLGWVERHDKAQSFLRLWVGLPGQQLHREYNQLEVWADHQAREVRFGPDKGLRVQPVNRGLGRFLLARGTAWARKRWGSYTVEGGTLPTVISEEERLRRDQALSLQGFAVEFLDKVQVKARYVAPRVSALNPEWNQEKVQTLDLLDAAAMLQQADQNLHEQSVTIEKQNRRIDQLRREDSGLRFTIACLVALALFQAGLLIWIATR